MKPNRARDILLNDLGPAPIAVVATTVISDSFNATSQGCLFLNVVLQTSALTAGAGVTIALQHSINPADVNSWTVVKTSAAITTAGYTVLKMNNAVTADQSFLPLLPYCRIVLVTGAGSSVTIQNLWAAEPA